MSKSVRNTLTPENWVANYGDYLFNFAITRVYSSAAAEDLVQDTFFSALQNRNSFRGDSTERTWLTAILKRKIIDHYRKQQVRKEENLEDNDSPFRKEGIMKGHWEKERAPSNKYLDEDVTLDNEEFLKVFNLCLSRLPGKLAAIFTLKIMEEMETEEICKELNVSSSNIWTSLHRGRLRLRECIEKHWSF